MDVACSRPLDPKSTQSLMAEQRREEGNAFFSKGDLCAASVCYEQGMLRLSMHGRVRVEIIRTEFGA